MALHVKRTAVILQPDQTRVLLRPFLPGSPEKCAAIIARVMSLTEDEASQLLEEVSAEFSMRHQQLKRRFTERFEQVHDGMSKGQKVSQTRCLLIGACFLAEYSAESAALFNPSIVPHPDQTGLAPGALRFALSLRATGEGHISSITFRSGIIHQDQRIEIATHTGFLTEPRMISRPGADKISSSGYELQFEAQQEMSTRILFPKTRAQRNGIEDARFVLFDNGDGSQTYYATFTAYDGTAVTPELLETTDFLRFRFSTLTGPSVRNKGMALFPRRIGGRYAMLSRPDNENLYLMYSDDIRVWREHKLLLQPAFPWELIQIGNCGSPIETDAGWLVLSHGVGPMREYCIGAFLLDQNDPSKVIGRLKKPLLKPNQQEREGYVPNVVYTCGALLHGGELIIPYGLADHATGFATVALAELLAAMD